MNFSSESSVYRIRRHSSQVGEGKKAAYALLETLKSSGLRICEMKAKKALREHRNHFCPEHWEVRARFHSFVDRMAADKIVKSIQP